MNKNSFHLDDYLKINILLLILCCIEEDHIILGGLWTNS